jgi:peptidyl-dipeptidase Dcp
MLHIFFQDFIQELIQLVINEYKWAEVLDADVFRLFKERGIFSPEIGTSFRENILFRGASEHPMVLYVRFRGREPTIDAFLKRNGMKK